jgi:hypothetical protein
LDGTRHILSFRSFYFNLFVLIYLFNSANSSSFNNLSFIGSVDNSGIPISIITVQLTNTINNNSIFQLNQANSYLSFKDFIFSLNYSSTSTWYLFRTTQLTPRFMLENCHFKPAEDAKLFDSNSYIISISGGFYFCF